MDPLYRAEAAKPEAGADALNVLARLEAADLYPTAQESACPLFRDVR